MPTVEIPNPLATLRSSLMDMRAGTPLVDVGFLVGGGGAPWVEGADAAVGASGADGGAAFTES